MNLRTHYISLISLFILAFAGTSEATFNPPTAYAAIVDQGPFEPGDSVHFTDNGSFDPDGGQIVAYKWTFPDEAFCVTDSQTSHAWCKFKRPTDVGEEFNVYLSVQDDEGAWSYTSYELSIQVGGSACGTWYVSADGDDESNHGRNENNPFRNLQTAIDAADQNGGSTWDSIIVDEGVYYGNISFSGKGVTIKGVGADAVPFLWSTIDQTVIHGDSGGPAVRFTGSGDEVSAKLEGVTIEGGRLIEEPIAHWKMDEYVGNTASDSSGSGYTGTLNGDPTWSPDGRHNGAIVLDGIDDYVQVEGYEGVFGASSRTFAAWIRYQGSSQDGDYHTIASWGNDNPGSCWMVALNSEAVSQLRFFLSY
jgi:hypothetical protein